VSLIVVPKASGTTSRSSLALAHFGVAAAGWVSVLAGMIQRPDALLVARARELAGACVAVAAGLPPGRWQPLAAVGFARGIVTGRSESLARQHDTDAPEEDGVGVQEVAGQDAADVWRLGTAAR
jgi:hypothetical protein